jgi:aspartate kinase
VPRARKAIKYNKDSSNLVFEDLVVDTNVSKVSVVGIGMRSHAGVAAQMFNALKDENINIKVITTSEIKISVLIDRKYLELAVQALHDTFELDN